ncbi:uncharacterized protein [Paramisgurnus dabryanus]|uniref:uncharacterized protein isoform X3 n=1 Tax=Paramisgurnus dabryanus TaxID=90735 RepID=UPI0031F41DFA
MPPNIRLKHSRCFVIGCKNEHRSIHLLPTSEELRTQWITFIFKGNVPQIIPRFVFVCANHFTSDCFVNEGQYNAGFAKKLLIRDGSVPTIRDPALVPGGIKDNSFLVISGQLSGIKSMTLQTPEGIQAKNESDRQQAKTTIDIGAAFPLWQAFREKNGFRTDTELAFYLLKRVRGEELSARSKKRRLETLTDVLALQKVEREKNSSQSSQDHQSTDKDDDAEMAEICYEVPFPSQTDESAQTELESEDQMLEDGLGFEDQIISEVQIKSEDQLEEDVSNDSVAPALDSEDIDSALDSEDIDPQISTSPTKKEIKKEPAETEGPPENRLEVGVNSDATSDKICHSFVQTANPVAVKEEHTEEPLVSKKTHLTGLFRT